MKILLVDDEPFVLKLLARQLSNLGLSDVVCHERARDALGYLESTAEPVDVIFCDLQMPHMDGVEFVRQLVPLGFSGALVLMSGENERTLQSAQRLASAHKLRVLRALRKPISPDQLRQVLTSDTGRPARASRGAPLVYGPEELRRAIHDGELENHYQPKVAMASREVTGVETLVRWRHPRDGLVFPDQFITTAETHGLIDELTRAVLAGALRQARLWQDMGLELQVAVNVSMDNLAVLDFPDLVEGAAAEAGVPLNRLMLEVTESRLMKNPLAQLDILTRLRLKHVGLSIDDFGTGHSSFAQLRDIPFDELKVDRGFVHGACRDASLRAIFQASVGMARQLGIKSVAEGVEDQEDWDYLCAMGCDLAQGYFIARPMSAADVAGWLVDWEARRLDLQVSAG